MKVKFIYTPEWDEVTAVFLDSPDPNRFFKCYAHIGQHGICSKEWFDEQKEATPEQYADLLRELSGIYETLTIS
jgi:hypothetical protein